MLTREQMIEALADELCASQNLIKRNDPIILEVAQDLLDRPIEGWLAEARLETLKQAIKLRPDSEEVPVSYWLNRILSECLILERRLKELEERK